MVTQLAVYTAHMPGIYCLTRGLQNPYHQRNQNPNLSMMHALSQGDNRHHQECYIFNGDKMTSTFMATHIPTCDTAVFVANMAFSGGR